MPHSKAYVSLGGDGSVSAVCIIVDDRHAGQAKKSLQRSHPQGSITLMSVGRALGLMRQRQPTTQSEAEPRPNARPGHFLRQGNM
jgi:hypothetical protein